MFNFKKNEKIQLRVVIGKHWAVDAICEKWAARGTVISLNMDVVDQVVEFSVTIPRMKVQQFKWDIQRLIVSGILVEIKE